jgi:integrase
MPNDHFTNRKVAELTGKRLHALGNNLYVRQKPDGRKYYVFVYRQRVGDRPGQKVEMAFGPTAKLDIRAAEEWAHQQNALIAKGIDPRAHKIKEKESQQHAALTRKTFTEVAEQYYAENTDPKNPKHWDEKTTTVQMGNIKKRILDHPTKIGDVLANNPELVQLKGAEIINSVAESAPVMALRFRDFLFGTMDLARDLRCYQGDNPFRPDGPIKRMAPIHHTSKPRPGWHHKDAPRLMSLLRAAETDCGHDGLWTTAQAAKAIGRERFAVLNAIKAGLLSAKQADYGKTATYLIDPAELQKLFPIVNSNAEPNFGEAHLALALLQFLLLTAVRFNEANHMVFDEIRWMERVWTIPAERTKKRIEHVVPLSPPAYEILKRQEARGLDSPYVFARGPSLTGINFHFGKPLSGSCVLNHLHKASGDPFITQHSFRRNCRSWAKDRGYSIEIRKMILGHAVGNATDGTYEADAQCVDQCRKLLEEWANYLNGQPPSANVVSFTERRAINA